MKSTQKMLPLLLATYFGHMRSAADSLSVTYRQETNPNTLLALIVTKLQTILDLTYFEVIPLSELSKYKKGTESFPQTTPPVQIALLEDVILFAKVPPKITLFSPEALCALLPSPLTNELIKYIKNQYAALPQTNGNSETRKRSVSLSFISFSPRSSPSPRKRGTKKVTGPNTESASSPTNSNDISTDSTPKSSPRKKSKQSKKHSPPTDTPASSTEQGENTSPPPKSSKKSKNPASVKKEEKEENASPRKSSNLSKLKRKFSGSKLPILSREMTPLEKCQHDFSTLRQQSPRENSAPLSALLTDILALTSQDMNGTLTLADAESSDVDAAITTLADIASWLIKHEMFKKAMLLIAHRLEEPQMKHPLTLLALERCGFGVTNLEAEAKSKSALITPEDRLKTYWHQQLGLPFAPLIYSCFDFPLPTDEHVRINGYYDRKILILEQLILSKGFSESVHLSEIKDCNTRTFMLRLHGIYNSFTQLIIAMQRQAAYERYEQQAAPFPDAETLFPLPIPEKAMTPEEYKGLCIAPSSGNSFLTNIYTDWKKLIDDAVPTPTLDGLFKCLYNLTFIPLTDKDTTAGRTAEDIRKKLASECTANLRTPKLRPLLFDALAEQFNTLLKHGTYATIELYCQAVFALALHRNQDLAPLTYAHLKGHDPDLTKEFRTWFRHKIRHPLRDKLNVLIGETHVPDDMTHTIRHTLRCAICAPLDRASVLRYAEVPDFQPTVQVVNNKLPIQQLLQQPDNSIILYPEDNQIHWHFLQDTVTYHSGILQNSRVTETLLEYLRLQNTIKDYPLIDHSKSIIRDEVKFATTKTSTSDSYKDLMTALDERRKSKILAAEETQRHEINKTLNPSPPTLTIRNSN